MRWLLSVIVPLCAGSLLGGLFGGPTEVEKDTAVVAAEAAGDYGVDVSTQIHGRLSRNTFQV